MTIKPVRRRVLSETLCVWLASALMAFSAPLPDPLPDPDGQEANLSKPVQVFILMGQSNMLGFGKVAGLKSACDSGKYPYLVDDSGNWTVRNDVRNVFIMNNGIKNDGWLTVPSVNNNVGVELPIGHYMGELHDAPVLILKSCIGNRSLGWDLLPPSVTAYEHNGKLEPGHGETPGTAGQGPTKPSGEWYAGKQWDTDIEGAHSVLKNLDKHIPGAKGYEVAGFFWWQGDKDMRNPAHADNYEKHLVHLVKDLRKEFDAPNAAFVSASLGQTDESDTSSGHGKILHAMKNLASGKYSGELGNNIGFVYTKPLSMGGSSSGHYGGNAETYVNVGEAMGKTMAEVLGSGGGASAPRPGFGAAPGAGVSTNAKALRVWTDNRGQKLQAFLHRYNDEKVQLRTINGQLIVIPRARLSAPDQAFVDAL